LNHVERREGTGPVTAPGRCRYTRHRRLPLTDTQHAADLFGLRQFGNIYTRIMNPTTEVLEQRVAELEGGVAALAVASGQAAETLTILTLAQAGDEIVASTDLYGGTVSLFSHTLKKLGITVRFVSPNDMDAWEAAVTPQTKAFFVETIGNPKLDIIDLEPSPPSATATASPWWWTTRSPHPTAHPAFRPRRGHCRPLGHQVHRRPRHLHRRHHRGFGKFRLGRFRPVPRFCRTRTRLSRVEIRGDLRQPGLYPAGPGAGPAGHGGGHEPLQRLDVSPGAGDPAPENAAHSENGMAVARFWKPTLCLLGALSRAGVLPDLRPGDKYLPKGQGALVGFGIKGGQAAAVKFIESLQLFSHLANIGDAKSLVIHPASTTHEQLSAAEQQAAGVTPDFIRLSVGIEDVEDIIADLDQALETGVACTV
jgi:O-acetylhomoserine (thiol)-lyase